MDSGEVHVHRVHPHVRTRIRGLSTIFEAISVGAPPSERLSGLNSVNRLISVFKMRTGKSLLTPLYYVG